MFEHFDDFSDERVRQGCAYCGGPQDSEDHVPSRVFLDHPYPANSPVVPACLACNQSFSLDEEYVACLIEVVLAGSTEAGRIERNSIRKTLVHSPALVSRLDAARRIVDSRTAFAIERDRVNKVFTKLAVGHSWYELADPKPVATASVRIFVLPEMAPEARRNFETPILTYLLPEVGSRGLQRWTVTGGYDWITVQPNRYLYLAVPGTSEVRVIVREYVGCAVTWPED